MSKQQVAVIILNWNGGEDTFECLTSLNRETDANKKIYLVDNASIDNSAFEIKKTFPDTNLIKNSENLGFAAGNNIGIRAALSDGSDYILLLNNDTVVKPNFLSELIRTAESDEKIGIVGPKIYFYDSCILWFAGGMLNRRTGFTYHLGEDQVDSGQFNQTREVDFISGCAMLVKREVFEAIGCLDEDYYHSHEDADFCLRARTAGFKVFYVPKSIVYHKLARASGGRRSPFYLYYRTRNHLLFKHKQHLPAPFFWPVFIILVIKRVLGSFLYRQHRGALGTLNGIYDYFLGKWGKGSGDAYRS